jgi:hypothetical protein
MNHMATEDAGKTAEPLARSPEEALTAACAQAFAIGRRMSGDYAPDAETLNSEAYKLGLKMRNH